MDRICGNKPAKLLDFKSLTLKPGSSRFGPVYLYISSTEDQTTRDYFRTARDSGANPKDQRCGMATLLQIDHSRTTEQSYVDLLLCMFRHPRLAANRTLAHRRQGILPVLAGPFPGISLRFKIRNLEAYVLTASANMRRKFPPPIFPISSALKPVFNMASTTT